ncbi:MAG: SOS response-associated peptidase [Anaerolineae bacterium]|nr:SOS response-associated peptidase [Anaerolineae bacterium]
MCGRFSLTADPVTIQEAFPWLSVPSQITPRYNIAPSQPIAVVPNDGKNFVDFFVWGLIPSWAKDPKLGSRMINARGETLAEKASFRAAYKRRRCLVLADGFYEWVKQPGDNKKTPYFIHLETHNPFAFAGLWEIWYAPDGSEIKSATIITTEPNEKLANLHNRMPVILNEGDYATWLAPEEQRGNDLDILLQPFPAAAMQYYPVSTTVNNPRNDTPACIIPAN